MQFVDTNIFIRYLVNDDPVKAQACRTLFEKAARDEVALTTSESVIAEVVFVLSSKSLYGVPRDRIAAMMYPLLTIQKLSPAQRGTYFRALDLYATTNLDFEDALTVAHMEGQQITDLLSYDRGFDRLKPGTVTRMEP